MLSRVRSLSCVRLQSVAPLLHTSASLKKNASPGPRLPHPQVSRLNKVVWHSARINHKLAVFLTGAVPTAVILSPSALNLPVDIALSVALPLHAAIGLKWVCEDYVPRRVLGLSLAAVYALCGITGYGLLKSSISDNRSGVTETVKEIWRK